MNKFQEATSVTLGVIGTGLSITDITNVINLILLIVSLINICLVLFFNIKKHIEKKEYEKIPEELEKAQNSIKDLLPKQEDPQQEKLQNSSENEPQDLN